MELEELIHSVDIVEYISQFVDLEQRGDEWWGLSCFREEKTPSFSVRKDPPVFYDYSSGVGGNLYTFIKRYFKCSSMDAVDRIKKYAGIDGEITCASSRMAATIACKKYARAKHTEKSSKVTILPDDYMLRYENRADKLAVWEAEGISKESLKKFQVMYDSFSDRLVYPIKNRDGKIVNIGGRTLDPKWKEKELRKYCYFYSWGKLELIYGLFENLESVLEKREIILFEGCKSVLLADTYGIHNTGALLTSHLNPHQMKILAQLGVRVVFALDRDVDITKDHNIERLKRYVYVEYVNDKNGFLDPKDSPVDKGADVFNDVYNNRLRLR